MRLSDEGGEGVLESEVMEEEVMYWNVLLSLSEYFVYLPLVKGTSDENERVSVLERVMERVRWNESSPAVNVENFGRSDEMNQINHTSQIQ